MTPRRGCAAQWVGLEPLEPRILYSVSPLGGELLPQTEGEQAAAVEIDGRDSALDTVRKRQDGAEAPDRELVIVDQSVPDHEQLLQELLTAAEDRDIEILVLEPDRDGVEQITEALAERSDLDAVHIISHGNDTQVQLGGTRLGVDDLAEHRDAIRQWSGALSEHADLLFYGCDLAGGAEGRALLASLAELTGADIAASSDLTGSARLGGDWDLEYSLGAVESETVLDEESASEWTGVLAAPVITSPATASVPENQTAVMTVTATDADFDTVTFSLTGGVDETLFEIDGNSGVLTFKTAPDFEAPADADTNNDYEVEVTADDGNGGTDVQLITVSVTDVNDVVPVVDAGQSFNVSESAANATSLGTVTATDPDTTGSLQSWAIVSGNGDGIFQINASTGEITVVDNSNLDRETTSGYVLGIEVSDGVATSATENVTINVTDVNDTVPVVDAGQSFDVSESAANATSLGTVTATDPDTTGSLQSWTIVSGNGDGIFQINASTGEITVVDNSNLDRETTSSYVLGIEVSDGVATSATENVTINVTDANDTVPVVDAGQSFNVSESAANATSLGTVTATDPDTTGTLQSWTIVSGNGDGIFQINASTGEITIADNSNLDYETTTGYVLGIEVSDGVATSVTETVTINVTDANDVVPVVDAGRASASWRPSRTRRRWGR